MLDSMVPNHQPDMDIMGYRDMDDNMMITMENHHLEEGKSTISMANFTSYSLSTLEYNIL